MLSTTYAGGQEDWLTVCHIVDHGCYAPSYAAAGVLAAMLPCVIKAPLPLHAFEQQLLGKCHRMAQEGDTMQSIDNLNLFV